MLARISKQFRERACAIIWEVEAASGGKGRCVLAAC